MISVRTYNNWTDSTTATALINQIGSCSGTKPKDEWVFDYNDCNSANKYDNTLNDVSQSFGSALCIEVLDMTTAEVTSRYNGLAANCNSNVIDNINNYYLALTLHQTARKGLFDALVTDISTLSTNTETYNDKLDNLTAAIE